MDYQTFVERLNAQELAKKIETSLNADLDIFVDVEEDLSVTNRFDVKITICIEKIDRFFNYEEVYLFKVDLDENDVYEDAEVSVKIDVDQLIRLTKMIDTIEQHFINTFEGE